MDDLDENGQYFLSIFVHNIIAKSTNLLLIFSVINNGITNEISIINFCFINKLFINSYSSV